MWFVTCFRAAVTLKNISGHESFMYSLQLKDKESFLKEGVLREIDKLN